MVSVLAVLNLIALPSPHTKNPVLIAIWGLLGIFLLYWLNTQPIRQFFALPKAQ